MDVESLERRIMNIEDMYALDLPEPIVHGIKKITCKIQPSQSISIPLMTVFNLLHTSEVLPMIQYHSGKEETILYKLYSPNEDINGNKIPWLEEGAVSKKNQAYKKSVTLIFRDETKYVFKEDGSVWFEVSVTEASSIENMNAVILVHQSVLNEVIEFMEQSGYVDFPKFTGIENATIVDMTFSMTFNAPAFKENVCGNRFFISLIGNEKRYIRVSNFNESKLANELCLYEYLNNRISNAVSVLKQVFNMTTKNAEAFVQTFRNQVETLQSTNENASFKVKEMEGFPTRIEKAHSNITFTLSNIKSVQYLASIVKNIKTYMAVCTQKHGIQCEQVVPVVLEAVHDVLELNDLYENMESDEKEEPEPPLQFESDEELPIESERQEVTESKESQDLQFEEEPLAFEEEEELVFEEDSRGGAVDNDLILNNTSFVIFRIRNKFKNLDDNYTKKCQLYRCPIALNEDEKKHPNVKKFSVLEHDGNSYICPKYWDMQRKIPLTEDDVKDLRIIDRKKVKDGRALNFEEHGTVLQLTDKEGDYPYPALLSNGNGPCCFKKDKDRSVKKERNIGKDQRIIHTRTRPLHIEGAVAYIPQPLQYFFHLNEACEISENNHLLRYGINPPSSFMDCITSCIKISFPREAYTKEKVIDLLLKRAESNFTTYNNGRLSKQFTWVQFKEKIHELDYTYLWEIINDVLKVNLVLFRTPTLTELEIICPSNHYLLKPIDRQRRYLMILEHHHKYSYEFEPLIEHDVGKNMHTVLHAFESPLQPYLLKIEQYYDSCKPVSEYYTTSLSASVMYARIKKHDVKQVTHNDMCIGFAVENVFIPCYPSPILTIAETDMPLSDYEKTISVLNKYAKDCNSKPRYKVVSNDMITGIITQTNSFVPCALSKMQGDLPIYPYSVQHEYMELPKGKDKERMAYSQHSAIEKKNYVTLRSMLKFTLAKNYKKRKEINELIKTKSVSEKQVQDILADQYIWVDELSSEYIKKLLKCKGACKIIPLQLPKLNLLTRVPNNYFSKLAQELNQYIRYSTFILKPQLLIPKIPFSLNDDEMVLTASTIDSYFLNLNEPKRLLSHYTTYDNAKSYVPGMFIKKGYIKI